VNGFAKLSIPLMDALAYSHRNGVVHRDIKPANIMLLSNGTPCLTDFGIAKSADSLDFTQTSNVLGTPAYMSPEQADGTQVDGRTDQYSLAITFYRAITGRLPFSSVGPVETLVQRLKEDPEPIDWHYPDFPVPLKHVLMKALSRDREDRYPTIESMKKSMLTACEACHVAWQEPFSLKGLEHLTALNRKPIEPIEPGESGLDDDMETMTSTMSVRNARARRCGANWMALAIIALVVVLGIWAVLFLHPTFLRSDKDKSADGSGPSAQDSAPSPEGTQAESNAKPAARLPAPSSGKTVVESKPQEPDKKRAFMNASIKAGQVLHLPHDVVQSFEAMGFEMVRLFVTVGADGNVTKWEIMGKLPKALTNEERRSLDIAVRALKFNPAEADDGTPVAGGTLSVSVPFEED
jgi:serine/threonine-protein kinase